MIALNQTNLRTTGVVRHLLWHKALIGDDDDGSRINAFIDLVHQSEEGAHHAIRDDFHRDLAIAFELVIDEHLDPWDLDLSKFAHIYLEEARRRGIDLVTAGRIILMAWTVLKLQSDDVAERATKAVEEEEVPDWDEIPDWGFSDEEWDYTERIRSMDAAPIEERIRHKGDRRVTLMELINAFEEIHVEAQDRAADLDRRRDARTSIRKAMRGKVDGMMHREDLAAEIDEAWQRILEYPTTPIPFSDLHRGDPMDLVQTLTALLFLCKDQKITLEQDDFPIGEIWVTPVLPEAAIVMTEKVEALKALHIVEAALFSAGRPLSIEEIAEETGLATPPIRSAVDELAKAYAKRDTVLEVAKAGRKWAMQVRREAAEPAAKFAAMEINPKLLKTLALIAYHQPVKQSDMVDMIGSRIYDHVPELKRLGLIRAKREGQTKILHVTPRFPEYFGLDAHTPKQIREMMGKLAGVQPSTKAPKGQETLQAGAEEPVQPAAVERAADAV